MKISEEDIERLKEEDFVKRNCGLTNGEKFMIVIGILGLIDFIVFGLPIILTMTIFKL